MTKGEKWKRFFEHRGWINDDVISGKKGEKVIISVCPGGGPDRKTETIDSALILKDFDILCYETRTGTVFFQWDDITQVKLEEAGKKRGWL